jgi:hypothetical protein
VSMTDPAVSTTSHDPAVVILAHSDPVHVRRLVAALDPFPVFLHCDARTPPDVFDAMTEGLPSRCVVLPRRPTPWASWDIVPVELDAYRAALSSTAADHVILMSGSDYPLAGTDRIRQFLAAHRGRTVTTTFPLPIAAWGRSGGMSRLHYRHRPVGKRMLRIPLRRSLPEGIVPAGGSQWKVLARHHAAGVVEAFDSRPDLQRFWRRSWVPDETFVPSMLHTPEFTPDWADSHDAQGLWYIDWGNGGQKSPAWLTMSHLDRIREAAQSVTAPKMFARKFSTSVDTDVLDAIDQTLGIPVEGR